MITLYQFETSPFCDKIRRILNYKQITYRIEEISLLRFTGIKKRYPVGKLPFIVHEGNTIGDSTDIAYYLEEQFPGKPILPEDPKMKAMVHFFEDWADESLYFYEMRLRFGIPHNAKMAIPKLSHADGWLIKGLAPLVVPSMNKSVLNKQGIGRRPDELVVRDVQRHVESVGSFLEGNDWLVGDTMTLADISVFAQLFCINDSREGADIISSNSNVCDWMKRVDEATSVPSN